MTNLPYIAASYALGIGVPAVYAVAAWLRVTAARRKLAAIDPRAHRLDRKGGAA
jgi:cytochrome c biogenesis protein CcdA